MLGDAIAIASENNILFHTDRNCPTSEHIPIMDLGKAANKRTLSKHILFMKFFTFVLLGVLNSRGGWVGSAV